MIRHPAKRMHAMFVAFDAFLQATLPSITILFVKEDILTGVTA